MATHFLVKEGLGLVVHISSGCVAKNRDRDRDRDRCVAIYSSRIERIARVHLV
jgi:hypothetical protein